MKNKLLLNLFLILLATAVFAQQYSDGNLTVKRDELTYQWTQIHVQEGILFSAKIKDCNRPEDGIYQEMVFLKLVNTTDQDMVVSFDLLLWFDDTLWTRVPVSPEKHKSLVIETGGMLETNCKPYSDHFSDLAIFSWFLNYSDKPKLT